MATSSEQQQHTNPSSEIIIDKYPSMDTVLTLPANNESPTINSDTCNEVFGSCNLAIQVEQVS